MGSQVVARTRKPDATLLLQPIDLSQYHFGHAVARRTWWQYNVAAGPGNIL